MTHPNRPDVLRRKPVDVLPGPLCLTQLQRLCSRGHTTSPRPAHDRQWWVSRTGRDDVHKALRPGSQGSARVRLTSM